MSLVPGWDFEQRVLGFFNAARAQGFAVSLADALTAVEALHAVEALKPNRLRAALRSVACRDQRDWVRFDAAFDQWFLADQHTVEDLPDVQGVAPPNAGQSPAADQPSPPPHTGSGASDVEGALHHVDLATLFDQREMREVEAWIDAFTRQVKRTLHRRPEFGKRGRVQFSRTLRAAHSTGGEPFKLRYKRPERRLPHLVVFVDVSHSMAAYSRFFLQFAKGLAGGFESCDVYGFDTELIPMGNFVQPQRAQTAAVSPSLMGWRGGTRIAGSLDQFITDHAKQTLRQRTTVLILSDGYDTAPPDQLAQQLGLLRRRVRRILWLHPLLEKTNRPALDPSLVQSLPYIERVLPAHSLAALGALIDHIR